MNEGMPPSHKFASGALIEMCGRPQADCRAAKIGKEEYITRDLQESGMRISSLAVLFEKFSCAQIAMILVAFPGRLL